MVHEHDEEAQVVRDLIRRQPHYKQKAWEEMPRLERQKLMDAALSAERGLTLQIAEAQRILDDHSEIRKSLPRLQGEIREEARTILNSNEKERVASDLRSAFNASREAWLEVPTFMRHKSWDTKLKKRALKLIKELTQ